MWYILNPIRSSISSTFSSWRPLSGRLCSPAPAEEASLCAAIQVFSRDLSWLTLWEFALLCSVVEFYVFLLHSLPS